MVKKKDDEENKDLTRIEDLSEFLHQEDSGLDSVFDDFASPSTTDTAIGLDLEELDSDSPPELPALPSEDSPEEEVTFEATSLDEVSFELNEEEATDFTLESTNFEESTFDSLEDVEIGEAQFDTENVFENEPLNEENEQVEEEVEEEVEELDNSIFDEPALAQKEIFTNTSEKFEDVKTFAQNFSYGKASLGGGNPPFSIIVRHVKFQDDADSILGLLREFGIVTDQNEKDHIRALELGSIMIPQISEYTAIVLAHKLRRFDLDLEVGLSDEVHPSKSGESNPKGLLKKDNLRQNRTESLKLNEIDNSIKDIIVSTTTSIPGYFVESYIGVQTTFAIVEESELEKLQYVQKSQREHSELYDYNTNPDELNPLTTDKAYRDYQNSFALLYEDLTAQLKQKAYTQHANALLGLNFQLAQLQFERAHSRINAYQITCSATLAIIGRDNS